MGTRVQKLNLDTSELRARDVILTHGMRVLLRGEAKVYPSFNGGKVSVYRWEGLVANLEDVKADKFIPLGWLYPDKWGAGEKGGWGKDWSADPTWAIQGNRLVRWCVERVES